MNILLARERKKWGFHLKSFFISHHKYNLQISSICLYYLGPFDCICKFSHIYDGISRVAFISLYIDKMHLSHRKKSDFRICDFYGFCKPHELKINFIHSVSRLPLLGASSKPCRFPPFV